MKTYDALSIAEKISSAMLVTFGFLSISRGTFWVLESEDAIDDSPLYTALHNVMPLWCWGLIFILFGIGLCLSSFFIPRRLTNLRFEIFLIVGGLGSSAFYFFLTVVAMSDALNWLTPVQFLIQTVGLGLVGVIGVISYARKC